MLTGKKKLSSCVGNFLTHSNRKREESKRRCEGRKRSENSWTGWGWEMGT